MVQKQVRHPGSHPRARHVALNFLSYQVTAAAAGGDLETLLEHHGYLLRAGAAEIPSCGTPLLYNPPSFSFR